MDDQFVYLKLNSFAGMAALKPQSSRAGIVDEKFLNRIQNLGVIILWSKIMDSV